MDRRCCVQCHYAFTPCRNPLQRFCNKRSCQNARKRQWRKQKRSKDPDYHENQRSAQKKWQAKSPKYWRDYRKAHPKYTYRNRQKTRERKQLASCKRDASRFAKSDALQIKIPIKPGTYSLVPIHNTRFAKSDALTMKFALIT